MNRLLHSPLLLCFTLFAVPSFATTLDEFAKTTQNVIAKGGFDEFQPTAIYPARKQIKVLARLPTNVADTEARILWWAARPAQKGEEFLVAFKIDSRHFKIIRCVGAEETGSKIYAVR